MKKVIITDSALQKAASEGMDAFLAVFIDGINNAIGGELNADNMTSLNSDQITLLGYHILRDEVMNGGFVQLIHNGYGEFFFKNPFARAMREWGLRDLYKLINKTHKLYDLYHDKIEIECSDEEFMALFEQFQDFDTFDDEFVENEELWTDMIAHYVDEHIDDFALISKDE